MIYNILLLTSTIAWGFCIQRFQAVQRINLFACAAAVASCVLSSSYSNPLLTISNLALALATTTCGQSSSHVAILHLAAAANHAWLFTLLSTGSIYGTLLDLAAGWMLLESHIRTTVLQAVQKAFMFDIVKLAISLWNETWRGFGSSSDENRKRFYDTKSKFHWDPTQRFSFLRSFLRLKWKKVIPLIIARYIISFVTNYKSVLLIQIFSTFATAGTRNTEFVTYTTLWILSYLAQPVEEYIDAEFFAQIKEYSTAVHNYFIEEYFTYKSDYDKDTYSIRCIDGCCDRLVRGLNMASTYLPRMAAECTSMYYIISKMGWLAALAPVLAVLFTFSVSYMDKWAETLRKQTLASGPQILQPEAIVANMRTIKQYAWNSKVAKMLCLNPDKSIYSGWIWNIYKRLSHYGPHLITKTIIMLYARDKGQHTFVEMSILLYHVSQLKDVINNIDTIAHIIQCLTELENYLHKGGNAYKDIKYISKQPIEASTVSAVELNNCCFSWGPDKFSLQPLSLAIKPGSFVTVVGRVGSGKSSLLSALCGEMPLVSGRGCVYGRLGYVSQKPWIMNATFRENVLFGNDYEEEFYKQVICACALDEDLKQLPAGDQTEIGHKGINLSGGQKARLALARAIYNNADVYMLDDILSAVDAQVERHLVEQVLSKNGILNGKTCILVTHAEHVVPLSDIKITLDNGNIDISQQEAVEFIDSSNPMPQCPDSISTDEPVSKDVAKFNINPETKQRLGNAMLVWKFISLSGYGIVAVTVLIQLVQAYMQNYLLNKKLDLIPKDNLPMSANAACQYFMLEFVYEIIYYEASELTTLLQEDIWQHNAIRNMKGKLLQHLLDSKITTFERLPRHSIESIFNTGIYNFTSRISEKLTKQVYYTFCALVTLFGMMNMPIFMIFSAAVPVLFAKTVRNMYTTISNNYEQAVKDIYLVDDDDMTDELLDGHEIIRVHDKVLHFANYIGCLVMDVRFADAHMNMLSDLCSFAMDLLEMSITLAVLVYLKYMSFTVPVTPGSAQELIKLSNQLYDALNYLVKGSNNISHTMDPFKQYLVYAENIDQEAPWVIPENSPTKNWPSNGVVEFQDYNLRYRDELDTVLHNLSFSTKKHEKIGIVGRTGAGKSSLSFALLRLVEADSGSIVIDGVDISTLGLSDLRSRISMVPQDPMLLQGTMRMNLDPAQEYTDEELGEAIDKAHIRDLLNTDASKGKTGLNTRVDEGGINFSVGQRQLISLCRALLWKRKIVILDEATANIDTQMDQLMQSIIRKEFAECTVLTIAHRLKTVMDSDRIMVMDQGKIVEFDTPDSLLAANGQFSKLVESMEFNESTLKQAE